MENSNIDLDKYVDEVNDYVDQLAEDLGHPNEQQRVMIIWRAVMHAIRDRIHIGESLDLISPLPMILKGMYTMGWQYHETPPYYYETVDGMKIKVKELQNKYGETDFDWNLPTEEIISITIDSLKRYLTEDQMNHIRSQLTEDIGEAVI